MNVAWLIWAAAALAATPQTAREETVTITMVAVQATNEGGDGVRVAPELKDVQAELADLKYDTYRMVRSARVAATYGKETKISVDGKYDLYVTPLLKEDTGRIRLKTRIEEKPARNGSAEPMRRPLTPDPLRTSFRPKARRNVLEATSMVVPGDKLRLGGPKLDKGRLVVVLSVQESSPPVR